MTSCDCGPGDRQAVDLGIHVERDRARIAQRDVVVAGGLVGIDIHASAGVVRHRTVGPRRSGNASIQADGIAPVEISRRCRDLPQRIILCEPVEEQAQRRPTTDVTVLAVGPEGIESALKLADLHEPGGGLDEDWAAAVARSSPAFERRRAHGEPESVGIIRAQRVAELGEAGTAECQTRVSKAPNSMVMLRRLLSIGLQQLVPVPFAP